ncbi:hypothetical protein Tco_0639341 [Tanacetum coccineum]
MIGDLWVEAVISVKGVPWVGDGGVSGVSLSVVSSSDDKNGEIAGNGGIWSDDGSSDGSDTESDVSGSEYVSFVVVITGGHSDIRVEAHWCGVMNNSRDSTGTISLSNSAP